MGFIINLPDKTTKNKTIGLHHTVLFNQCKTVKLMLIVPSLTYLIFKSNNYLYILQITLQINIFMHT